MEETPTKPPLVERLPWYTVPGLLIGIPALAAVLSMLSPSFYANVVWKYYWGPIKADATTGVSSLAQDGVIAHAGYNPVNTVSWAVLLGLCILGLAQMLRHFRTPMDNRLIVGATLWVVAGSVFHVMQDTDLFLQPLEFFFITPPIYLLFAAFGVLSFLMGHYLRGVSEQAGLDRALQKIWLIFAIVVLGWMALWLQGWPQIVIYLNPALVALFAVVTFIVAHWRISTTGRVDATEMVMVFSIGWLLASVAYVAMFLSDAWSIPTEPIPHAAVTAPGLAGLLTLGVYAVAKMRLRAGGGEIAQAFTRPINLLIVFAQMVDGFATSIGLDLGNYTEKHITSAGLIEAFRGFAQSIGWTFGAEHPTFLAFAPVKFGLSLLVVWIMDVYAKADWERNPTMMNLIKFAIIMVGIGPGVRDFTRMALGV